VAVVESVIESRYVTAGYSRVDKYNNGRMWREMKFGLKDKMFIRDEAEVVSRVGPVGAEEMGLLSS